MRTMLYVMPVVVVVLLAGGMMGCKTITPPQGVYFDDANLAKRLSVQLTPRDRSDIPEVAIQVQNLTKKQLKFRVKTVWLNKAGIELEPERQVWKPITLLDPFPKTLTETAPNPGAVTYKVYIAHID
ncbi:MAG TPA: YcfL family protein [Candidatus Hydrogenedentes bacterium]|nr:YcfL family protein [Candidatus Hydrogenedentota bacterium]